MTAVEFTRREEIARLLHQHWLVAVRATLAAAEPLFRSNKRTPENSPAWANLDKLVLLASKKWECLKGAEREAARARAEQVLHLLAELGELQESD